MRLRVCDAAEQVLRETGNPAVMWGDSGLLHLIAERVGMKHEAWVTERKVLAALARQPGKLTPYWTYSHSAGRLRRVRGYALKG